MSDTIPVKVLHLNDGFTAWDISVGAPWPFPARIHRFTAPDGSDPHDHPFGFHTHVVAGGYVEEVFHPHDDGTWHSELVERLPGTMHYVPARHIHRIVRLLEAECWTMVVTGPGEGPWSVWRFDADGYSATEWKA